LQVRRVEALVVLTSTPRFSMFEKCDERVSCSMDFSLLPGGVLAYHAFGE
jgi:hypothetical protein